MKPVFYSERLWNLKSCGIASIANACALATHNESALTAQGWTKGKAGRRADLLRGWKAFKSEPDNNGIPDQADVERMLKAMYAWLPMPRNTRASMSQVWDWLDGHAVSIALDLSAVPAVDALRRYTNPVAHQVVIYDRQTVNGRRVVRCIDPMHPHSNIYRGHRVNWDSVKRAALSIGNGRAFVQVYPINGWTDCDASVEQKNQRIAYLVERRDEYKRLVIERDHEIAQLGLQLAECRDDGDPEAAREQLLDALHEWEMTQRL
jgi:hypothetical protein